jgi:glycosyltransferase involved in cell wall biosynthesis
MVSILIPVFNYDISNLVYEIHKQCNNAKIKFEIICYDDNSDKYISENKKTFDSLANTRIINSEKNLGRTGSRQILCESAIYNWLLFLDADVIPKSDNYIEHYIHKIKSSYEVIYGGFAYTNNKPNNNAILRWKYGRKFEEVDASKRNLKPYQIIISANFLIKKTVFNQINSKLNRKSYGLDNYFAALLKQNNYRVLHINNEVYHFGLEKSSVYLNKVEECIITLLWLLNEEKMVDHNNKLLSVFIHVKSFKLNYLMSFLYLIFNLKIKRNLLSSNPNMYLLQFYKILYICHKDLKHN